MVAKVLVYPGYSSVVSVIQVLYQVVVSKVRIQNNRGLHYLDWGYRIPSSRSIFNLNL